ncbi:hypothetical protein Harman_01160 [Haloarcula mannanilytica]|uniref:Uncharacterized protein n=1 Tax=Haloarcula mannanilytica TaxID=2509225 RepID=A0A4C2ECD6_9EURY|nr:hypothetical protein Harman_01160 [Haloarcula mannanilytica]
MYGSWATTAATPTRVRASGTARIELGPERYSGLVRSTAVATGTDGFILTQTERETDNARS